MISHRLFVVLIVGTVCFDCLAFAQKPQRLLPADTLARVGGHIITGADLLERIELMPWEGKDKRSLHDSSKIKALYSMVAEKLLALEAVRQKVGEDTETALMRKALEKMFVRDELYAQEVLSRVEVSREEIQQGLKKFALELRVVALPVLSESDAGLLYGELLKSTNRSSTLARFGPSFLTARDTLTVNFGGLDIPFEDAAYAIGKDKLSRPFYSNVYGWVVVLLLDKRINPQYAQKIPREQKRVVESVIRRRKEDTIAGRYYGSVLRSKRGRADSTLFEMFSEQVLTILRSDSAGHTSDGVYVVLPEDVDQLLKLLRPHLDKALIYIEDGDMSLGEVIEAFRYYRFSFSSLQEKFFKRRLNNCVKVVLEGELMAREGMRRGLQYSQKVRHDLSVWSDYWSARLLMRAIFDTVQVSEDEVFDFLARNAGAFGKTYEVNIREILSDSLETAFWLLQKIRGGEDMAKLARRWSRRKGWATRNGESGFFVVAEHPELGFRAAAEDIGKIVGPISVPGGYSIFEVLQKRRVDGTDLRDIDPLIENLRRRLLDEKGRSILNRKIVQIGKAYDLEIFEEKVRALPVGMIQMFTRRYVGFGGFMTAVPMLYPQTEWIKEWRRALDVLP